MEYLKPLLSTLVLPPAGPLLVVALGLIMLLATRKQRLGKLLVSTGLALAWLLSCSAVAVQLNHWLLKSYPPFNASVKTNAEAIVVLGGGLQNLAPEFGNTAQPSKTAAVRLRYGAWLAKQTGLPLAFTGGRGWAAGQAGIDAAKTEAENTEAAASAFYLSSMGLPAAKWLESESSDTAENATQMAKILKPEKINHIILVTHDWHLERAIRLFEAQGFQVKPASVAPIGKEEYALLDWLPSAIGMENSRHVLREALALLVLGLKN